MTTAWLQLLSPAFISLQAGFCVRSSCSPPLSGSNYIHESGTNSFCSYKAVLIFHCPSISYLKTSGESAFPIRKGQSISISSDRNFDFKVLWNSLGFRYLWINTLHQPLPPSSKAVFLLSACTFEGIGTWRNVSLISFSVAQLYSHNLCVALCIFCFSFISNHFVPLFSFCKCTKVSCLWKYLPEMNTALKQKLIDF